MVCSSAILSEEEEEEPSPPCLSPTSLDVPCSDAPCVPGSCTRCSLDVYSLRHAVPRAGPATRSPAQPESMPQHRPRSYLSRWAWQSRKAAFLHLLASSWLRLLAPGCSDMCVSSPPLPLSCVSFLAETGKDPGILATPWPFSRVHERATVAARLL